VKRTSHLRLAFGGIGVLGVICVLDFVAPTAQWYAAHPMTAAAIATALGFIAAGMFLEDWVREREARRLDRISTVAYRSLAQYANDAGRSLVAPLTGADLHALGIPDATELQAEGDRMRLQQHGIESTFAEATGSWRIGLSALCDVLVTLLHEQEFVRRLYRQIAVSRRRLQEGTALWAPVMLTSGSHTANLGKFRELTDAFEVLQERLRNSGLIGTATDRGWTPTEAWLNEVREQFSAVVGKYELIRDEFGTLGELPSDAFVDRLAKALPVG